MLPEGINKYICRKNQKTYYQVTIGKKFIGIVQDLFSAIKILASARFSQGKKL